MLQERRHAKRFSSRIGMVFRDESGLNFSFITNISRNGMFLETQKLLAPGTSISFMLSNSVSHVPVEGTVARVKDAMFEGPPSGIGVKFERMDEMAKIIRDDILLYLMNLRYQQIWMSESAQAA